jgi:glutamate-1-semialdehyde 2,1-aminomutase
MGLVAPDQRPGTDFLVGLRKACDVAGALLLFDEVITGFRLRRGSCGPLFNVVPDLVTFGKVIGGGCPIGAIGGRKDLLGGFAPLGPVYQAGTLSGNPLAMAAGKAVLDEATPDVYDALEGKVAIFAKDLQGALSDASRDGSLIPLVTRFGTVMSLYFFNGPTAAFPPRNLNDVEKAVSTGVYQGFFHHMLAQGIALAPGPYECMFVGASHRSTDLDRCVANAARALHELEKSRT